MTPLEDKLMLAAEHGTLLWLAQSGGLTETGLRAALARIRTPADVHGATHALAVQRDALEAALIQGLSAATGMPTSYWTDQVSPDVPDDIGDLA